MPIFNPAIFLIAAAVKFNVSTICLEKSQISQIFEEIILHIYKNLLWKIRYLNNQLQIKVRILSISSETMYLCSQLGGKKKSRHIPNQPGENPVIFFKLIFMRDFILKKTTTLFYNYYYY